MEDGKRALKNYSQLPVSYLVRRQIELIKKPSKESYGSEPPKSETEWDPLAKLVAGCRALGTLEEARMATLVETPHTCSQV